LAVALAWALTRRRFFGHTCSMPSCISLWCFPR
jgi:hypothetical protein